MQTTYTPPKEVDWNFKIDDLVSKHEQEYGPISIAGNLIDNIVKEIMKEQARVAKYLNCPIPLSFEKEELINLIHDQRKRVVDVIKD